MRMSMFVSVALAVLVATAATPTQADASETDLTKMGVHVIGDSITYRVHNNVITGADRPDGWTVDAFPGRRITALVNPYGTGITYPRTERDYWYSVTRINNPPRARVSTVVIALGTNGADEVMTVHEAAQMYATQIQAIRAKNIWNYGPKNIVLVTPWKDPSIQEGAVNPSTGNEYAPYQWADKNVVYRQAIEHVAANSGGVTVMPWHEYVSTHPTRLPDGIHPDPLAQKVWRNMVYRAVREGSL